MDVRQYLSSKGWTWNEKDRPSGKQAILNCPFCDDTKGNFAVSLDSGAWQCMRKNNCGRQGSWWDLQKEMGDTPARIDSDGMLIERAKRVEYKRPNVHGLKLGQRNLSYLTEERKFTPKTLQQFHIGQKDDKTIMIPYYKDSIVVNVKYRETGTKKMWQEKDAEPVLFNRDRCKDGPHLVITEGEFDAMTLAQYGIDAVSVPSGAEDVRWIEHEWEYLQQYQSVYLMLDYDTAGQRAVETVATRLGRWRCYRVVLPHKDANDCLKAGVDADIILKCISAAQPFVPDSLVSAGHFLDDVMELFRDDSVLHGTSTGFLCLDEILRGWRDEELTVWSGMNGSGKSTMLGQSMLNVMAKGQRVCKCSLEMPSKRLLRWMVMQHIGSAAPTQHQVIKALAWLDDKLYLVNVLGEITSTEVINCFEYAARKYGVKHFVLDSLMRIKLDDRRRNEEDKRVTAELVAFAAEHKVHVHLVGHPRKGDNDDTIPGKVDIAGTGNITNLAHNVIVLSRPSEELRGKWEEKGKSSYDGRLDVKKNREWGDEGEIQFDFDSETKRFNERLSYRINGQLRYAGEART